MAAAPEGEVVKIFMDDSRPIEEGDVVQTTTGRSYRVLARRLQTRGIRRGRQHLTVRVISPGEVEEDDVVHTLAWYSRGKSVWS